jgi:DNA-binding beta-propeller fold protein YncE
MKTRAHKQWRNACLPVVARLMGGLLVCALSWPAQTNPSKPPATPFLLLPNGLASDNAGDLYISDLGTHRIVKRDVRGRLVVIAGTGEAGFSGDGGPATKAQLHAPHDLLFDAQGNLLIADTGNHRIRKLDRRGIITTIAGDGKALQSNYNGKVPETSLNNPQSIALDQAGNLLIADTFNHVIRKLDRSGKMTVFAGSVAGYGGDGGEATKAQMNLPMAVTVAPDGSVYVSDAGNSRIRQITPDGKIKTIAGFGPAADTYGGGYAGDGGPPEKAKLFSATDLKCDAAGNLYIVDSGNHRLRVIRGGIITTIAGNGQQGYSGDGKVATTAELNSPQKVLLAKDGTLFISDRANHAVREVNAKGLLQTILRGASANE